MCRMGPEGWTKIVTQSIDTINEAGPENVGVTIFISMSEVFLFSVVVYGSVCDSPAICLQFHVHKVCIIYRLYYL